MPIGSNSVPFVVQCCIDGGGGNDNVAGICFDGKNLNACIVVTKTGRAVHAGLPQSLVDSSVSDVLFGFRYMAFGMNGAWAYETVKPAFAHCSDDLLSADIKARLNDPRLIQVSIYHCSRIPRHRFNNILSDRILESLRTPHICRLH